MAGTTSRACCEWFGLRCGVLFKAGVVLVVGLALVVGVALEFDVALGDNLTAAFFVVHTG